MMKLQQPFPARKCWQVSPRRENVVSNEEQAWHHLPCKCVGSTKVNTMRTPTPVRPWWLVHCMARGFGLSHFSKSWADYRHPPAKEPLLGHILLSVLRVNHSKKVTEILLRAWALLDRSFLTRFIRFNLPLVPLASDRSVIYKTSYSIPCRSIMRPVVVS